VLARRGNTGTTRNRAQQTTVIVCVIFLCCSFVTPAAANTHHTSSEFTAAGNNVEVWDGAGFALHTKQPDTAVDANGTVISETIDRDVSIYQSDFSGSVNNPGAFVFADDARVRLDFNSTGDIDTTQFAGENVSLIAARLHSPTDRAVQGVGEVSPQRAGELLTAADRNNRATFRHVFHTADDRSARSIDEDGFEGFYYNLGWYEDGPGIYAFYVVDTDDPAAVAVSEAGRLTVTEDVRILGADVVAVHDGESTVDAPFAATVGDELSFDSTLQTDSDAVSHTVLVYNPATIENTEIAYEPQPRPFLGVRSPRDVRMTTTGRVRGSIDADPETTIYGARLTTGSQAHGSEIGILASHIRNAPLTTASDAFDASLTARADVAGDSTIAVQTHAEWDPGTYHYVHIVDHDDRSAVEAANGTIELVASGERYPTQRASVGHEAAATGPTVEQHDAAQRIDLSVRNLRTNQPVVFDVEPIESVSPISTSELTITSESPGDETTVSIDYSIPETQYSDPQRQVVGYQTIESTEQSDDIRAVISIDDQLIDQLSVLETDIEFIQVDGTGDPLPTEQTADGYEVRLESPGIVAVTIPAGIEVPVEQHTVSLTTPEIESGDAFTVETSLKNPVAETVNTTIHITVNGAQFRTENVSLGPYEDRSVEYSYPFTATGTFSIGVDEGVAGDLTVNPAPTTDNEEATTERTQTDDSIVAIIFTIGILLSVGIVVVATVLSKQDIYTK